MKRFFLIAILTTMAAPAGAATLAQRLVSPDNATRASAQQEAAQLSLSDQKSLVTSLIRVLQSGDTDQKEHAAEALGKLGPVAEEAVEPLRKALSADFPYIRVRSAEALSKIGPAAIPAFIEALKNPNADVRAVAASALGDFGPQASAAIPALVKSLQDSDPSIRERAAHALGRMGPEAAGPLMDAAETGRTQTRLLALSVLGGLSGIDDGFIVRLLRLLEDPDAQVRMAAAKALLRQGPSHIPALMQGLESQNPRVQVQVADIFADLGKRGAPAAGSLGRLLEDPNPEVRASAVRALGRLGLEAAKGSLPAMRELQQDLDPRVAARAKEALSALGTTSKAPPREPALPDVPAEPEELPTTKPAVKAPSKPVPKKASRPAPPTPAQLIQQLESTDVAVSSSAFQALVHLGPKAVKPLAYAVAKSTPPVVRQAACQILGELGPVAVKALPDLKKALLDPTTGVRESAATAFRQIDSTAALQAFQETAKSSAELQIRLSAISALGQLGPQAQAALPLLVDLLQDPTIEIQTAAADALDKIGTEESKKALESFRQRHLQKQIMSLIRDLRQPGQTSDQAIAALVKLGSPVVTPVGQTLKDPAVPARQGAAKVLNQLGAAAAPATPSLIEALDDSDPDVRHQASQALQKINTPETQKALRFYPLKEKFRRFLDLFKR